MDRYTEQDCYDDDTNAPSRNFIYDFDSVRWLVNPTEWREVRSCPTSAPDPSLPAAAPDLYPLPLPCSS